MDSKKFDTIRFQKMENKTQIEQAFEVVKNFIQKKKLLLAGGMSIDFALRLKGTKLYGDDVLPDYDFLSPTHWEDAYELAELLCKAELPDIDIIGAFHVSTQRVRVMGTVVADITYAPLNVFKDMKHLTYGGLYVLHPWYTILDQFTALGMPYENPPHEVILERWKKDITRLALLLKYYPLDKPPIQPESKTRLPLPTYKCVLQGWAALAYYNNPEEWDAKAVQIPQPHLTIMTDDWQSIPESPDRKYFSSMMGFPRHFEEAHLHVHDTLGLKIGVLREAPNIVSLPALMWYFMHRWLRYGDYMDQLGAAKTLEHIDSGRWKLDISTYGSHVWNMAFVFYIRSFDDQVEKKLKPPRANLSKDCEIIRPQWRPEQSWYFHLEGAPAEKWEPMFDLQKTEILP